MNNKDKIEEFIHQNRVGFDDAFPSLKVWTNIEKELNQGNYNGNDSSKNILWKGLGVSLLILLLGAYFITQNQKEESKTMLFAEVENLEQFYQTQSHKMIKSVSNDFGIMQNPDLQDIDKHISEIKQELGEIPKGSEEKALKALFESYRTKLMIIEKILEHHEISQPSNNNNTNEHNI